MAAAVLLLGSSAAASAADIAPVVTGGDLNAQTTTTFVLAPIGDSDFGVRQFSIQFR